jgi:ATP-dependent exoDNAse (exonuclease V) beta subunit
MRFIESVHKYIDEDVQYTPVTYFIKSFQPFVDWEAKCRAKAKKLGMTYEELRAEWDNTRDTAANKGTAFHKRMEDAMVAEGKVLVEDKELPLQYYDTFAGIKEDTSMELQDNTVYAEKMIWNKKYGVCGTADLVQVVDGKIHVLDYKTNKKLDKESWRNPRTGAKQKLLAPCSSLDDCNFNVYQLQLNTYMYMLLKANRGLKRGSMQILYIIDDESVEGGYRVETHKVNDLQNMVQAMFEKFKTN